MKTITKILPFFFSAILAAGCAPPTSNAPVNVTANSGNISANSAIAKNPPPSRETLSALEKQAFEAWKNKDAKFFEGFLTDNFVSFDEKGQRMGKAELIKMIGTSNCEFKNDSFSDERMIPAGADAAVIVMKVTADYTCGGKKGPSPVTSASVYVRSGDSWKAAYHNEVPIVEPVPTKQDAARKAPPTPAAKSEPTASGSPADPLTEALMALEKRGWEAWKDRDRKALEDMTAADLSLVDSMGGVHPTKADVMKVWIDQNCDIKSVNVSNGRAVQISPDAAILTFKGSADAVCSGQAVGPVWGTNVLVRSGDTWKTLFFLETPA